MDKTLFHLLVIFIVGLALGVNQYRDRILGEALEKNNVVHASMGISEAGPRKAVDKRFAKRGQ
jgi:hypothetical protein